MTKSIQKREPTSCAPPPLLLHTLILTLDTRRRQVHGHGPQGPDRLPLPKAKVWHLLHVAKSRVGIPQRATNIRIQEARQTIIRPGNPFGVVAPKVLQGHVTPLPLGL